MLWRRLPRPLPLSALLAGLRARLAARASTTVDDPALVWAAVAVVLAPGPDSVLLIRRAVRAGDPWSGHMALPGGRRDPDDPDLLTTAIRETVEEVGLHLRPDQLIGTLADVAPRSPVLPPIAVRPFVFAVEGRLALEPNAEVATARWIALDRLLHPESYHSVSLQVRGEPRDVLAYHVDDAVVWGMTERILTELLDECRALEAEHRSGGTARR